jgi:hypothetical protein
MASNPADLFVEPYILSGDKELTTAHRKSLPRSAFAIPESRKYPIHDKSHARNALARVSQHGTPEEKKRVRAAVHRRYPSIGKDSLDQLCPL